MTLTRKFMGIALAIALCMASAPAFAQSSPLEGHYRVEGTGTAMLVDASPSGCVGNLAPAGYDGTLDFNFNPYNGKGTISSDNMTLDIAGTVCTQYKVTGTYKVDAKGPSAFNAQGTLFFLPATNYSPCNATALANVNFSINGSKHNHTIAITTFGSDESKSSYAAGKTGGSLSCTAAIQDYSTIGTGSKMR